MIFWNTELFLFLNAPGHLNAITRSAAKLLAHSPVVVVPLLLACLWIWGRPESRPAHVAIAACLIAGQSINVSLGMLSYELGPFMSGQGHTFLKNATGNSFSGDGATICWSCGPGLILTRGAVRWGISLCLIGLLMGLARVYLGGHYPLDELAAAPIGLLAGVGARVALPIATSVASPPVERLYESVLTHLPAALPLPRRTRV
jgi:undecaprenyl-diphosphatase